MPVILATWEAEIGRIAVQGQARQKVLKTLSQPTAECRGTDLSLQAMQEAKIGRITVLGQHRQKSLQGPYLNGKKLGVVPHICHPSHGRRHKIGGLWSRLNWAKSEDTSPSPK
jgi:hypothetical protein